MLHKVFRCSLQLNSLVQLLTYSVAQLDSWSFQVYLLYLFPSTFWHLLHSLSLSTAMLVSFASVCYVFHLKILLIRISVLYCCWMHIHDSFSRGCQSCLKLSIHIFATVWSVCPLLHGNIEKYQHEISFFQYLAHIFYCEKQKLIILKCNIKWFETHPTLVLISLLLRFATTYIVHVSNLS